MQVKAYKTLQFTAYGDAQGGEGFSIISQDKSL